MCRHLRQIPGKPNCSGKEAVAKESGKEILLELYRFGNLVKLTAVDPETLIEVSIVGDPAAGEQALKQAAINKLEYVLRKRRGGVSS